MMKSKAAVGRLGSVWVTAFGICMWTHNNIQILKLSFSAVRLLPDSHPRRIVRRSFSSLCEYLIWLCGSYSPPYSRMPASCPDQPSESSAATDASIASRAISRPPARHPNPHDIHATIPSGTRSWEHGMPVDFTPPPDVPGAPPLPPPMPEIRPRHGQLGTHLNYPEEFSLSADAPTPRPPPRDRPFDPLDDVLTSQGFAPRSSRPVARHGSAAPQVYASYPNIDITFELLSDLTG